MSIRIQIGCQPVVIDYPIAPGSPFVFAFKCPDRADWTGIDLACDVRDMDNELLFRVTSEDSDIVVDEDDTELLTMTWSAVDTAELADHTNYKFDVIEVDTKAIVWPLTKFTTTERVTE